MIPTFDMKKNLLIIVFQLFFFFPQLGITSEIKYSRLKYSEGVYFSPVNNQPFTGKTKGNVVAEIKDGIYQGEYRQYYSSGKLRSKGQYLDGKKNGRWTTFHENGKMHSSGQYRRGKWEGVWIDYYEDGSVRSQGFYVDGARLEGRLEKYVTE